MIDFTGPNDSSRQIRMFALTSTTNVGFISVFSARSPTAIRAPLAIASSSSSLHMSTVARSITEPSTTCPVGSPVGSDAALRTSLSVNSSAIASSTMMRSADMQI
jgi:hypothetical protein